MDLYTRLITRDWYTGAALTYRVEDASGSVLGGFAAVAMTEDPAGSGSYKHLNSGLQNDWVGRIVFTDGTLTETQELSPPSNVVQGNSDPLTLSPAAGGNNVTNTVVQERNLIEVD